MTPIRNLIVYADGRVCEVPFRLEGLYYIQTDLHEQGRTVQRVFRGEYAADSHEYGTGMTTMVYVERPSANDDMPDMTGVNIVNGTPVAVDAPMQPRNRDARWVHKDCRSRGGHQAGSSDHCSMCGLSGYVIRTMRHLDEREETEAKESAALRDKLVKLSDECKALKVENSDLRRDVERLTRRASP